MCIDRLILQWIRKFILCWCVNGLLLRVFGLTGMLCWSFRSSGDNCVSLILWVLYILIRLLVLSVRGIIIRLLRRICSFPSII